MPSLSPHIASVPPSGIRRIFEIALELDDVISLAVGEPDRPVAAHILAAGAQAWRDDLTNYSANGGIPPLRSAIVQKPLQATAYDHPGTERLTFVQDEIDVVADLEDAVPGGNSGQRDEADHACYG